MRRLPDPELIAVARTGSRDAAEALFDRYWPHAWKAAYAVTADRGLADDAAQEAMERAFRTLDRFDETRPFGPWLKRIAVNRAIDHLRRRGRRESVTGGEDALHGWAVGDTADEDLRLWAVADAVGALAEGKRLVVVLHYWLDLPLDEIAEALVGAVREAVGTGETVARSESSGRLALMPWVTLLALLPLVFLLFRRNFWLGWRLCGRVAGRARTEAAPEAAKVRAPRGVAQPG